MTLLVQRQVTHTCESQWSDPRLASFIQGQEESGHTVHKGRKARRTSWILKATTLGFIYTLNVLLSKLSLSVSVSSNNKVLTHRSLLIAYLIVLTDATVIGADYCSGKAPRYDKPSLKIGELSGMCQPLAQGGDKSRQTTQSHWKVLQAYVLYARTRRGFRQ